MGKVDSNKNMILDLLQRKSCLSTQEVMQILGISESTVRRLFFLLAREGKVVRTYGGIQGMVDTDSNYSFEDLENLHLEAKSEIARRATEMLSENDIIYLDCGTTMFQVALALKTRLSNQELRNISVTTNSLANMQVLHAYCDVILIGGTYRERRRDFCGYVAEKSLQFLHFTKSFLGADGFTSSDGFMASDLDTAKLDEIVISRSEENYALLDATKIGRRSFIRYAQPHEIHAIITDHRIRPDQIDLCRGIQNLLICEEQRPITPPKQESIRQDSHLLEQPAYGKTQVR